MKNVDYEKMCEKSRDATRPLPGIRAGFIMSRPAVFHLDFFLRQ